MPGRDLDSVVDELYAAPREEFIALRKERSKAARAAGDTELAAEIDKLAKPTTAAWLVNQLARTDAGLVAELAALGDALRQAHAELAGAEIKSLSHKRTELIRDLVGRAEEVSDGTMSESVTRELEDILTRSVADEDAGHALVAGRMTSAKSFAPASAWPTLPAGERPAVKKAPTKDRGSDKDKARAALEAARAAVKEAESARADDERALADAEAAVEDAAAEVKRLGEELDAAEARERRARGLVGSARRAAKEAERQAAAAWKQVQQAEQRLATLEEE